MKCDREATTSLWMATDIPPTGPLEHDEQADVCVVGAGIAGLTTAYLLAQEGLSVVVVDDGLVAGGQTSRTSAHLSYALDDRFAALTKIFGTEATRLAMDSHRAAIDKIEHIVDREAIACDFLRVDGFLFAPWGERRILDEEWRALQNMGVKEVVKVERAPLDFFDTGPCLRFPDAAQFHPLRYMRGLVMAFQRLYGRIFTDTHVVSIEGGEHAKVEDASGNRVFASHIVVATNSPVNVRVAIHTK